MKVLLAIDSSEFSEPVISEVASRPWPADSIVFVLTVIDLFALTYSLGYLKPFIKNENDAARALVQSVADRLASRGIETVTQVVEAHPSICIVEQAANWDADFIFVGSHGHSGVTRFFLGSIAKGVLRNATCSVVIVRRAEKQAPANGKRVLLATDGSAHSEAAARSVSERPWPEHTEFKVVSVVDPMIPVMDPWYAAGEVIDRIRNQNRKESEEAVASAHTIVTGAGLTATTSVLSGNPKRRIIECAKEWDADLIVIGSHGRRGLNRLAIGSVSEAVAMNAQCSVEVIRSRALLDND
ncbi:MAG: universal stress protein [Blastocatellia bacterium]